MQGGLDFLKTLDIKEIQSKTHISLRNLEAILSKSYDQLERIHFSGFISILEREYEIDLSELSEEYAELNPPEILKQSAQVNMRVDESSDTSSKKGWLVFLLLIVGVVLAVIFMDDYMLRGQKYPISKEVNDSQIKEAKEKIQDSEALSPYLTQSETNLSLEEDTERNSTVMTEENMTAAAELNATSMSSIVDEIAPEINNEIVVLIPRKKVWIGMIELSSLKKTNRVTMKKIEVDSSKDWLIVFGHGQVNIQKDDEVLEFNKSTKIYFIYENGKLKQIKKAEFKMHNQGRTW